MKQKIKAMMEEDRGVSPVIGVILMVAITVILAAVIGTFVLGLGDSLQQTPQAQLDAELTNYNDADDNDEVVINHNGGDPIKWSEIRIEYSGDSTTTTPSDDLTVGNSQVVVDDDSDLPTEGETITLIHEPSDSIILEVTL